MKQLIASVFFLLFLSPFYAQAQVLKPIAWKHSQSPAEAKPGDVVELVFTVTIERDWYLYSTDFDPDLGPMVTTFDFTPHPSYELAGEIKPMNPKRKIDPVWDGEISYFEGTGEFRQAVKILAPDYQIAVEVSYQVCTDITGRCIPLEDTFTFTGTPASEKKKEKEAAASDEPGVFTADIAGSDPDGSLWSFILVSFLWGIAAIFTPCVFPMIPMTVAFFTNRKGKSQALFYGFSIILIYTLVGAFLAPLFGPAFANFISTHWLPNVLFFLIFLVFALSFFGMFDIVMPSSLVNKMDQKADQGGMLGPFFMAFTLVLVSFSCTGPIVGSILVQSAGGAIVKPIVGMFTFGLAFALPFSVFALFPRLMSSMPKSGGWLNSVKVTLGFIELALAFKFLSVADQVYHWGILDREVNIAIWIAISLGMGLYYLGYIRLPHDDKMEKVSVPRLLLALTAFTFVVYLIPGMFGAPLKALSGFLPPRTTHDFDLIALMQNQRYDAAYPSAQEASSRQAGQGKHSNILKIPHGIKGYFDLEEGMEAARREGKPVFIDFTGHGCVNCRKMEDNVWGEPEVLSRLKNDYVVIALYVDDRTVLPESEWVTSSYDGKVKKTIGAINADYQIATFNNNAQPFYILLDHQGELLANPKAYDLNVANFVDFLDKGLAEFEKRGGQLMGRR
jgi:thiol:disulfide interchange protein DsbD